MDGPREGPLVLLFLLATIAASAFVLHSAEADAVKDPKQKAARGEITGLSKLSLVRPENLRDAAWTGAGPAARLAGTVEFVEPLGHEVIVHARVGEDLLVAKTEPHRAPRMGDPIELAVELDALHLFDAATERRLD